MFLLLWLFYFMQLTTFNLLPDYFPESRKESSEIWGKELEFQPGDRVKIVAPSGSGKTSLIHFIYGLRSDYRGIISFEKSRQPDLLRKILQG
jgi:putative ABC transport system ATP-binding protein